MSPIFYIFSTTLAIVCILFGWSGEGILYKLILIWGGVQLGHILTEALNYVEGRGEE
jgi:hypothetical protein